MTDNDGFNIRVALIDRDPGDETPTAPVSLSRSYRATYIYESTTRVFYRDLIGPDSFLHAVELAENMRDEGERLLNVQELT